MSRWLAVCAEGALDEEDVRRFDHEGRTFAIYRDDEGAYFASDGLCTHERVHLADGFVIGKLIECPRHQGRFSLRDGKARGGPVCVDLVTYAVKVEDGTVFLDPGSSDAA